MENKKNSDSKFPTLEKMDFRHGLDIVSGIESGKGPKWSPFERGKYITFSGLVNATRRLKMNSDRFDKNSYDDMANNLDSSNTSQSYPIFTTDDRVAALRDVIGQRYSASQELPEVTRGAFAIYRATRVAFGEEEFTNEDIDLMLKDIPPGVIAGRLFNPNN